MEMPDSIELLTTALKDRVPGVRVEAVRALGETKNPRALEPLEYALTDPEPDVRAEVADALQLLKTGRGKVASSPFRSVPRPLRPRLEDLPPASTGTWPAAACGFLLKLQGVFGMCYWGVWMIPGCIVYKPSFGGGLLMVGLTFLWHLIGRGLCSGSRAAVYGACALGALCVLASVAGIFTWATRPSQPEPLVEVFGGGVTAVVCAIAVISAFRHWDSFS